MFLIMLIILFVVLFVGLSVSQTIHNVEWYVDWCIMIWKQFPRTWNQFERHNLTFCFTICLLCATKVMFTRLLLLLLLLCALNHTTCLYAEGNLYT
jgi:hypothetical protein